MTTKVDVMKSIEAVDIRVNQMTPRLLANGAAILPEGAWQVREVLCHLAARANSIPVATMAAERARAAKIQGQTAPARGTFDIDEINQRQTNDRENRSIQELLDEIHNGHLAALQAIREFDQPVLDEILPAIARLGDISFADLVVRAGPGHENSHLDQIEKVIGG